MFSSISSASSLELPTTHLRYSSSGALPIRQTRQLPKARHRAEARKAPEVDFSDIISEFVKRKPRKMFY